MLSKVQVLSEEAGLRRAGRFCRVERCYNLRSFATPSRDLKLPAKLLFMQSHILNIYRCQFSRLLFRLLTAAADLKTNEDGCELITVNLVGFKNCKSSFE